MSTNPTASPEQAVVNALNEATPLVEAGLTIVGASGAAAAVATIENLVAKALEALAAAKGQPVTAEDVLALLPAPIVLPAPTA